MQMSDTDTRDRVIGLERDLTHTRIAVDAMSKKVDELHSLMLQGKGAVHLAKWTTPAIAAVVAFAVSQLGGYLHLPTK
jgi:hypothetical protein